MHRAPRRRHLRPLLRTGQRLLVGGMGPDVGRSERLGAVPVLIAVFDRQGGLEAAVARLLNHWQQLRPVRPRPVGSSGLGSRTVMGARSPATAALVGRLHVPYACWRARATRSASASSARECAFSSAARSGGRLPSARCPQFRSVETRACTLPNEFAAGESGPICTELSLRGRCALPVWRRESLAATQGGAGSGDRGSVEGAVWVCTAA